ncbi:MAG: deoxyhypusine synthase family protein, partial [Candidatus Micrarchaeota archaeon]|nr:deoxyhypusine synthase family protein [Candidatus Micrarchaeota archaeon]
MVTKKDMLAEDVVDIRLKKGMKVADLIKAMGKMGGFSGQHMVEAIDITDRMLKDKNSYNFLSFPADVVSTGLRGVLASATKHFDAIMTTCGTLDHDIARAFGGKYSMGTFNVDDTQLHKLGVYRLGNVFIGTEQYGNKLEDVFTDIMHDIYSKKGHKTEWSPSELIREFGA